MIQGPGWADFVASSRRADPLAGSGQADSSCGSGQADLRPIQGRADLGGDRNHADLRADRYAAGLRVGGDGERDGNRFRLSGQAPPPGALGVGMRWQAPPAGPEPSGDHQERDAQPQQGERVELKVGQHRAL
ncbi:MAG TPA: hypothetical protein VH307_18740, partial [Streptosporangiaceae bacterium]|nr:hypothetical protein [Streptosporangiaceae bacterium]